MFLYRVLIKIINVVCLFVNNYTIIQTLFFIIFLHFHGTAVYFLIC